MNAPVYSLFWNTSHLKSDGDNDAVLQPFDGWEYVAGWQHTRKLTVPEPAIFEANFEMTRYSDYPCNDVNWPIMSSRMLEVLRTVGSFPHRLIPVRLLDRSALGSRRFLPNGSLRPEVIDDSFAAVQLTETLDIVDWERSEYCPSPFTPDKVSHFHRLIFNQPTEGVPPLFRLAATSVYLLISAKARQAFERADIRGVQFLDLPGWYVPERD